MGLKKRRACVDKSKEIAADLLIGKEFRHKDIPNTTYKIMEGSGVDVINVSWRSPTGVTEFTQYNIEDALRYINECEWILINPKKQLTNGRSISI